MKDERKSYIMYFTLEKMCAGMNDSDYAALMHAVANYALTGDGNVQLSDVGTAVFTYFKEMHDIDDEKWQEKRRMRAEAGKKGGIESGKTRAKRSAERVKNTQAKLNEVSGDMSGDVNYRKSKNKPERGENANVKQMEASADMSGDVSFRKSKSRPEHIINSYAKQNEARADMRDNVSFYKSKRSPERGKNAKTKQNEANEAVNVNGNVNANVNGNANVNVNENVNVNDNVNVNENVNVPGGGEAACNAVPTLTDVQRYFSQKDIRIAAEIFYDMNAKNGWRIQGAPIRDWKAAALRWAEKEKASGSREPPSYNINTAAIDALTIPKLVKRQRR